MDFFTKICVKEVQKMNSLICRNCSQLLQIFKEQVRGGSTLLISEKVILDDAQIDNLISRLHLHTKRKNFSPAEIMDKDRQPTLL